MTSAPEMQNEVTPDVDAGRPVLGATRRQVLIGGGLLGAVALVAACGDDKETANTGAQPGADDSGGGASADLDTAAFAASLEVLAVNTYTAALDAAQGGSLGEVPPAVAEYVTTAKAHHEAALDEWNKVLEGAGRDKVSEPPADLEADVNGQFAKVTDVAGAATLALELETIASNTYLAALPNLTDKAAIGLAGSLQAIDQQHAAVLLFALGEYPVPEVFQSTDKAAAPG